MSNLDTPNKEDAEVDKRQDLIERLHQYLRRNSKRFTYASIADFILSRETHLKEDLKVVDEEDELRKAIAEKATLAAIFGFKGYKKNTGGVVLADFVEEIMQLIKSRDQRIVLEAREDQTNIILGIVTKRGMPDNYYGEVAQWIKEGLKQSQKEE